MNYYSLNRVILAGRVGKPPEVRMSKPTAAARAPRKLAKFSLATNFLFKGAAKPRVIWHTCHAWGARADFVEKFLRPGSMIIVEGYLDYFITADADKKPRKYTFICVDTIVFMPPGEKKPPLEEAGAADDEEDQSIPEGQKDPVDKENPFA